MRLGISPPAASLVLTGNNATSTPGEGARTPGSGSLGVTGQAGTLRTDGVGTSGTLLIVGYQPVLNVSGGTANVQPGTAALTLTAGSSLLAQAISPTTGTLALVGGLSLQDEGVRPSSGTLTLTGAVASLNLGAIVVPTGSLNLAGVAPDFLGRMTPDTGTLTLSGTRPITGTHPTIPTAPAGEGCQDALITAVAREGCAAPSTGVSIESVAPATSSTCHYV
jgi:hypothetical protein